MTLGSKMMTVGRTITQEPRLWSRDQGLFGALCIGEALFTRTTFDDCQCAVRMVLGGIVVYYYLDFVRVAALILF